MAVVFLTDGDKTGSDGLCAGCSGCVARDPCATCATGDDAARAPKRTRAGNRKKAKQESSCVRKCLVTGQVLPKAELIRFALDPQGKVVPDLAAQLPGRGLWVAANRAALETAARKNLFARAAKAPARVDPDLLALVNRLFEERCLSLLGLARGAGAVVTGPQQIEDALKAGTLAFIALASDAGANTSSRWPKAAAVATALTCERLGLALGRPVVAAVGLRAHALSTKLYAELARWQGVSDELPAMPAITSLAITSKCETT